MFFEETVLQLPPQLQTSFYSFFVYAGRGANRFDFQFSTPLTTWAGFDGVYDQRPVARTQVARTICIIVVRSLGSYAYVVRQRVAPVTEFFRQGGAQGRILNRTGNNTAGAHHVSCPGMVTLFGAETANNGQLVGHCSQAG